MTEKVNIHGKEYETVASRVHRFRQDHTVDSGWSILTEIIFQDGERVIVRATIGEPDGHTVSSGLAEEYRESSKINRTSALENCETSAIGRALAAADYHGTEYCSADELVEALKKQADTPGLPLPPTDPASSAAHARAEKARAEMARAVNPLEIPESWSEKARDAFRTLFNRGVDVISKAGGDDFRTRAVRAFYAFDPPPLSLSELEPGEMEEYYDAVELMINNIQERMS